MEQNFNRLCMYKCHGIHLQFSQHSMHASYTRTIEHTVQYGWHKTEAWNISFMSSILCVNQYRVKRKEVLGTRKPVCVTQYSALSVFVLTVLHCTLKDNVNKCTECCNVFSACHICNLISGILLEQEKTVKQGLLLSLSQKLRLSVYPKNKIQVVIYPSF